MEFQATDVVVTHKQAAPPFYYSVRIIKQVIKTKAAPYKALFYYSVRIIKQVIKTKAAPYKAFSLIDYKILQDWKKYGYFN